jgi:hypothetical protein
VTPAARVHLDRRIADERMTELQPHGDPPMWRHDFTGWQPMTWTMDAAGIVSRRWVRLDEVNWRDVVAVRCEQDTGRRIDIESLGEDYGDC